MKNSETITTVVIVLLLVIIFSGLFGGFGMMGYSGYGGMMNWTYPGFGFMWIFGSLFMILILVALVLLIAWLVKQLGNGK
ncbi:MAG: hypothetical protein AABW80_01925 [Nanoarchaeota archaeon]